MKKRLWIYFLFLICSVFLLSLEANALTCGEVSENDIVTHFAIDNESVPYCKGGNRNLRRRGCMPLTIASILSSYGNNVSPSSVSSYLCTNHYAEAEGATYGAVLSNKKFQEQFHMVIEKIPTTIQAIDTALNANKMVLASVNQNSIFTSGTHYIGIAKKIGDEYYIINTGSRDDPNKKSKRYTKEQVIQNVLGIASNNGLWSVVPTECNTGGSTITTPEDPNGGSENNEPNSGRLEDIDIYENTKLETGESNVCGGTFLNKDGSYTEFGSFINTTFSFIKVATPIIVVILCNIDYIKAIAASNADEMKKANKRTVTRLIIGLLIFFLPFLLELIFYLFGLYDLSTCGIGS